MTTVLEDQKMLLPEFRAREPWSWLAGDDSYMLPPEWLAMLAS